MKTALTTGFLSLLAAAMPTAAETVPAPGGASWIPTFAISYTHYVSAAPEPLRLVMVGSAMILSAFVVRMVARKGAVATTQI